MFLSCLVLVRIRYIFQQVVHSESLEPWRVPKFALSRRGEAKWTKQVTKMSPTMSFMFRAIENNSWTIGNGYADA
jgi:hypothetical protein